MIQLKTNRRDFIRKTGGAFMMASLSGGLSLADVIPAEAAAIAKSKPTTGYAPVNGLQLYYEIHGEGKPLILLHGGLMAIEGFGPVLTMLAKGRQVIGVDLQAHGRTADIDRPFSLEAMAGDIAGLMKHLGLKKADIMGYSFGGGVALQTAILHPELVNKLVLVSTPFRRNGFYPDILVQQGYVSAAMADQMKQTPIYTLYAKLAPRPNDFPKLLDKIGEYMKKDFDLSKQIEGITAPTLIAAADADIFPPAHAVEMFGLLGGGKRDGGWDGSGKPKSNLAIIPDQTHYMIGADPRLAETAITFLDKPVTAAAK